MGIGAGWRKLGDVLEARHAAAQPGRGEPARMRQAVPNHARGQIHLMRKAVAQVALALATHERIDGDDHRLVTGRGGTLGQPRAQIAVAPGIELKKLDAGRVLRNVLDRIVGRSRQGKADAGL